MSYLTFKITIILFFKYYSTKTDFDPMKEKINPKILIDKHYVYFLKAIPKYI